MRSSVLVGAAVLLVICVDEQGHRKLIGSGYPAHDTSVAWVSATVLRIDAIADGEPAYAVDVARPFVPLDFAAKR
jgi:hypothetical protein